MSTYVLVHGAWHGGWCWDRVASRLRQGGHDVHAPTLSGMGIDDSSAGSDVGLRTHVDDDVHLLLAEDLRDDVLVGHSYAGYVVREAADRLPERVSRLVLVDAWVGNDGDSLESRAPEWFRDWLDQGTSGGLITTPPASAVGITDPDDVAWIEPLLRPQPRLTFSEPTRLGGAVESIPCEAIVCTPGNGMPFATWAQDFGWPVTEIASGHDVMVTAPEDLVRALA